jgi:hypothetical protein
MTIDFLYNLIKRDIPKSKYHVVGTVDVKGRKELSICFYTETNKYTITAKDEFRQYGNYSYLGCIAESRKCRPGEDWHRGNDLPDGTLSGDTWTRIMCAIVRYELQDVVKTQQPS